VLPKDTPDQPNTNTLTLAPRYDNNFSFVGQGTNDFGGNTLHINTNEADWVGAALHDLLHTVGAPEGYFERAGTRDDRDSDPRPGYGDQHIMRSRSGIYLRGVDIDAIIDNPTTIKLNLEKFINREKETLSE
jgi:hypothetical protein